MPAGSRTSPAADIAKSSYKSYLQIVLVEGLRWTSRCSTATLLIGSHSSFIAISLLTMHAPREGITCSRGSPKKRKNLTH